MNSTLWRRALLLALALGSCGVIAACGGGSGDEGTAGGSAPTSGGTTVAVDQVDGVGDVLVDSDGKALYSPEQEADGKILCTGGCEAIWVPLTVSAGAQPTGTAEVNGQLGTVQRPDGTMQVTFRGKPLYTFVEDPDPGTVTGNGFEDTFAGNEFTWHVAAVGATGQGTTGTTMPGLY